MTVEIGVDQQNQILRNIENEKRPPCKRLADRKNKKHLSITAKAALEKAFYDIGGVDGLAKWGRQHRTEFYRLWSKIIPLDLNAKMKFERLIIARTPETPVIEHQPADAGMTLQEAGNMVDDVIVDAVDDGQSDN